MTIKPIDVQQQVVIRFTVEEDTDFPGVIVLAKEVYDKMPAVALETMQQARYEEWRKARTPVLEADSVQTELAQIEEARNALSAREAELRA